MLFVSPAIQELIFISQQLLSGPIQKNLSLTLSFAWELWSPGLPSCFCLSTSCQFLSQTHRGGASDEAPPTIWSTQEVTEFENQSDQRILQVFITKSEMSWTSEELLPGTICSPLMDGCLICDVVTWPASALGPPASSLTTTDPGAPVKPSGMLDLSSWFCSVYQIKSLNTPEGSDPRTEICFCSSANGFPPLPVFMLSYTNSSLKLKMWDYPFKWSSRTLRLLQLCVKIKGQNRKKLSCGNVSCCSVVVCCCMCLTRKWKTALQSVQVSSLEVKKLNLVQKLWLSTLLSFSKCLQ